MTIEDLRKLASRRRLDAVLVRDAANVLALTGVPTDNAILTADALYTDFRYIPAARRLAPELAVKDLRSFRLRGLSRIGYESTVSHATFLKWQALAPRAAFVDIAPDLRRLRAVKTEGEIARLRAASRLNVEIWNEAKGLFRKGMTEREMARLIRSLMVARGDGEAFETIVCVGANAAECHHIPDDTLWNGRDPVLVDMGVRLDGVCSDMTRNLFPRPTAEYRRVHAIVREANRAAIRAVRPGLSGKALDGVARKIIREAGFGRMFGHSLGHGVGYEIHEAPVAGPRSTDILRVGSLVTIEPGIYLEGRLGVRIEDLVLVTPTGCEILTAP